MYKSIRHEFKTQNAANSKEGYHILYNFAELAPQERVGNAAKIVTCARRYLIKTKVYKVLDMKFKYTKQ